MSSAVAETRNRMSNSVNFKGERQVMEKNADTNSLGVLSKSLF